MSACEARFRRPDDRGTGQERCRGAGVRRGPERLQTGHHQHLMAKGLERLRIGVSSNAAPSAFGVQYSIAIPFGT